MVERAVSGASPDHHVAVVGGGIIGAAAALGVARRGLRVLLLEPARPAYRPGRLGLDIRTVALSPASRDLLADLEVWDALAVAPYRRMEVWEERGTRAMEFDAADVAREELGWIAESGALSRALWQALEHHPDVTLGSGRVARATPGADRVALDLDEAGRTTARLLIAADGARSGVREGLGVAVERYDVGQAALATVVRTERPHGDGAYQRFLLEGPVALLPTRDPHLSSVVWSQPPEAAERRRALPEPRFCAELAQAVQHRLGAVTAVDRRVVFPLQQLLAATFNPHPRVLLIGDAARVLHPLAGLGANVGFEDVGALLGVLDRVGVNGDPGAAGLWRSFDRQRHARGRFMLAAMGGLRRVYARGDPLSQWLRNLGVGWLNRAVPLKRQIIIEAMGLGPVAGGRGGPGTPRRRARPAGQVRTGPGHPFTMPADSTERQPAMTETATPRHTPLFAAHQAAGGKLVDFAGWAMPLHYGSQLAEHNAVRSSCGIFDVSHMTVVDVTGEGASAFLRRLVANDVARLDQPGKALYGVLLNDAGGVIDDLIVYRRASGYRAVVNAGTRDKVLAWFAAQNREGVVVDERDLAMLAVQGPEAVARFEAASSWQRVSDIPPFHAVERDEWMVARTGYTGEDGVEVILPGPAAVGLWGALTRAGVQPAGLGARDTLRLEAGLNLYGQDMDETVSPLEANLAWTVAWQPAERDFVGRAALERQRAEGVPSRLTGLVLEGRGVLRHGQRVITDAGEGVVTSGIFSPTLGYSIALARLPRAAADEGQVDVRGKLMPVRIVKPPFVRHGRKVFE